jgi:drug/metabolite transporter (DMT)-like permease
LPQPDNPLRGIALSASACAVFAIADTTSKYLSTSLPVIEIQWIRCMLFLGMAAILAARTRMQPLRPHNPKLQILRGLCVTGSWVLFVYGIREMTMAQATTISFLSPLLITVLSIPLPGEIVGVRRWGAVLAGMLIVVRPRGPLTASRSVTYHACQNNGFRRERPNLATTSGYQRPAHRISHRCRCCSRGRWRQLHR